jgi:hypothetical protein
MVVVTSLLAVLVVVAPITLRAAIVSGVMPFPFMPMTLLPLTMLPIAMPVIVPFTIPARANDNSGRRLDIHLLGLDVDRLRRIDSTRDSNIYSNIDVCKSAGRYPCAETGNQRHC